MKDWHCLTADISLCNCKEMESGGTSCLISQSVWFLPSSEECAAAGAGGIHAVSPWISPPRDNGHQHWSQDRLGGQTQLRQLGN